MPYVHGKSSGRRRGHWLQSLWYIAMDKRILPPQGTAYGVAQKCVFRLIFLPPYFSELNPIENFWAWLKRHLRSSLAAYLSFDFDIFDVFPVC